MNLKNIKRITDSKSLEGILEALFLEFEPQFGYEDEMEGGSSFWKEGDVYKLVSTDGMNVQEATASMDFSKDGELLRENFYGDVIDSLGFPDDFELPEVGDILDKEELTKIIVAFKESGEFVNDNSGENED